MLKTFGSITGVKHYLIIIIIITIATTIILTWNWDYIVLGTSIHFLNTIAIEAV
jgi:hypothetical protein